MFRGRRSDIKTLLSHCFWLLLNATLLSWVCRALVRPCMCSWRNVIWKVFSLLLFFHLGWKGVVMGKHCCWSGCHMCSSHGWAIERGIDGDSGGQEDREEQWFIPFHFVCSGTVQTAKCSVHSGFGILWSTPQQICMIDFVGRFEKWRKQCNVRCLWTEVMSNVLLDRYECFLNLRHFCLSRCIVEILARSRTSNSQTLDYTDMQEKTTKLHSLNKINNETQTWTNKWSKTNFKREQTNSKYDIYVPGFVFYCMLTNFK